MIETLALCIMILVLVLCFCVWKIECLSGDLESLEDYVWEISDFCNQLRDSKHPDFPLPNKPEDQIGYIGRRRR